MIRKLKGTVFELLYIIWDKRQKKRISRLKDYDKIYVFDIDNTLTKSILNAPINHISPIPNLGMISYVKSLIAVNKKVIYLSARDFRLFHNTLEWLRGFEILDCNSNNLFLVKSSMSKIEYLQILIKSNKEVEFVDDLSYNYEHGEVKYYDDTLQEINNLSLIFKGIDFINSKTTDAL